MRSPDRALSRRRLGAPVAFAALICLAGCATHQVAAPEPEGDPLVDLNRSFRQLYADARAALLSSTDPIIYVSFNSLVLLHDGQRSEVDFTPPIYDELKAISHIPLALYVFADAFERSSPTDKQLASLTGYREQVVAAAASLEGRGFDPRTLDRQKRIVVASLALIDTVLEDRRAPSQRELDDFASGQRDFVLANAYDAAEAQLDGLHAVATRWREELGQEAWSALQVVVPGGRQARKGNLQLSYFERLLGKEALGQRLFYTEGVKGQKGSVDLLGSILLDRRAGEAFFDDPYRLERDLLADAAREVLDRIFGSAAKGSI